MITVEYSKKDACITVMDSDGSQEDLQMMFDWDGDTLFLRQWNDKNDSYEVIALTKKQASGLHHVLNSMAETQ